MRLQPKGTVKGRRGAAAALTSLSIHGLPRHVAKQPNRPKMMMATPVPMRTYGTLVLSSDAREK